MGKSENLAHFGRLAWLYLKYQAITKGILALVIFPLSSQILKLLLAWSGRSNISSGDYLGFLFSTQGALLLLLAFVLLTLLIGIDINAFILTGALIREGKISMRIGGLLRVGLSSLKSFLKPSGLLIMLYVALILPLVGIGLTIRPMRNFQIPNFVRDVIWNDPTYSVLYSLLMVFLFLLSFFHIFFFHYLLLLEQGIGEALRSARRLMKKHWKSFLIDLSFHFLMGLGLLLILIALILMLTILAQGTSQTPSDARAWTIWGILHIAELFSLVAILLLPLSMDLMTRCFYKYNAEDGVEISLHYKGWEREERRQGKVRTSTKVLIAFSLLILTLINFVTAGYFSHSFEEMFRSSRKIEIIAHRGGGNLAAENSIAGIQAAIRAGLKWTEIDVQRTYDGHYIVYHDTNFERLAGDSRRPGELFLDEVKALKIRDHFDPLRPEREVATLEEVLDIAKGKIGLYIELKGASADQKMVDEIYAMLRERRMAGDCALISLDYKLIRYMEERYPELLTGFLYFFSIGDTSKMKADILIMEEREASPYKVREIQNAGKKAVVWTVNSTDSIDRFVKSEVDGIITDYPQRVREGMKKRDERSDFEIIIEHFLW